MIYLMGCLIFYAIDLCLERKRTLNLKCRGYDYSYKKGIFDILLQEFVRYIYYVIPFVNIFMMIELSDGKYRKYKNKEIQEMLKDGELIEISSYNSGNLSSTNIFKVLSSRKGTNSVDIIQNAYILRKLNRNNNNDRITSFSEYSTDKKIEMLLRELELLYEEKAREMNIDLDDEFKNYEVLLNDNDGDILEKKRRK